MQTAEELEANSTGILEHDYVIWSGDLNYRIEHHNFDAVVELVNQNRLFELKQRD
jgi:hypothetical protein